MELIFEVIKFIICSLAIVFISKQLLVRLLRKFAEILDLSPKAVGDVAGLATSMPELLTVFFSSLQGLYGASIYNIISSNVINFVQYIWSIIINKNLKVLKNMALKIELIIVVMTIAIPIIMLVIGMEANLGIVPIFILLFIMLYYVKNNAYKFYKMNSMGIKETEKIQEEKKWVKNKKKLATITIIKLLLTGIILFIVGNILGETLDTLSTAFKVPQAVIGIILGFVTSIPELITFVEAQKHHSQATNDTQGVIEATSNLFTSNMLNLFIIQSIGIATYMIMQLLI